MRILYIDIDSLRPDHLGCYGYHRNTSPAIDRIASEGVVFENCYTPDAPCLPSRTALYSGRFGIHTGVVGHGATAAQPKIQGPGRNFQDHFGNQGLVRQLQLLGFHTAMISPFAQRHAAWHFYAGFNETHNTGQMGMESAEVIRAQMQKMALDNNDVVDPLWTVIREGGPFHARLSDGKVPGQPTGGLAGFENYLTRLEETGRSDGAEALRKKYAAQIAHYREARP